MIFRCDLVPQYQRYQTEIDQAVRSVLESGIYTLGRNVAAFEKEFQEYLGAPYAIGVANGTDALMLALKLLGVGAGDEVITTPFSAIPTVSAIVAVGAKPVFVDVDPATFLMDITQVPAAITERTKAIMPVHIFGNVVDIPRLQQLTGNRLPILEDACQAHGSTLNGIKAGALGTLSAFSFYPTKNVGGYGDGGMVVAHTAEHAESLRRMRMYGMVDKDTIVTHGVNTRLDELQAAILRVKLRYLDEMNAARTAIVERYRKELRSDLFRHQEIPSNVVSNWHVFVSRFQGDREKFMAHLQAHDIQSNIYYPKPLPMQEANRALGYRAGQLPKVEQLCQEAIALTLYPELPMKTLDHVIEVANAFRG